MALDEKMLAELKQALLEEKKRLEDGLGLFAKPTDNPENFETQIKDIGDDEDDNATEVEEFVDNLALENTLETELKDVNAALERIENGTYGIDEQTGEEISIERLKAYPAAKTAL